MSAALSLEMPRTMARRQRKPRDVLVLDHPTAEYGPGHSLHRGQLKSWGGAAEVVLEERGDLDNPKSGRTIRGARRIIKLDNLLAHGTITHRHYDAVIQLFEFYSIATGGSSGQFGSRSGGMPATSLAERQVKAQTKARLAEAALGHRGMVIFRWVIIDGRSLGAFESHYALKEGAAGTRLRVTLTMLDEHFNPKTSRGASR